MIIIHLFIALAIILMPQICFASADPIRAEDLVRKNMPGIAYYNFSKSLFVTYMPDKRSLRLNHLGENSVINAIGEPIELPVTEDMGLSAVNIIGDSANAFIIFYFERCDNCPLGISPSIVKHKEHIWDVSKGSLVAVEDLCIERTCDFTHPTKILVKVCVNEDAHENQYRFYDLITNRFSDENPICSWVGDVKFYFDVDEQGDYHFFNASKRIKVSDNATDTYAATRKIYAHRVYALNQPAEMTLPITIADELFVYEYALGWTDYIYDLEESISRDHILTYRAKAQKTNSDRFIVPYLVDLKVPHPIAQPILNQAEMDALKSNVYCIKRFANCIAYQTHFEHSEWHLALKFNVIPEEAEFIKDVLNETHFFKEFDLNFWLKLNSHSQIGRSINARLAQQPAHFLGYENGAEWRKLQAQIRFLEPKVVGYMMQYIKQDLPCFDRCAPIQTASVLSPLSATMLPIYYTVPKMRADPEGYFIIDVHGGPQGRVYDSFLDMQQFFTSRGYPYLTFNFTGSSEFGSKFEEALYGQYGAVVYDINAVVAWAKEYGLGKIPIIYGLSFGGSTAAMAYKRGISDIVITLNGAYDWDARYEQIAAGKEKLPLDYDKNEILPEFRKLYGETKEIRQQNSVITTDFTRTKPGHVLSFVGLQDEGSFEDCVHLGELIQNMEIVTLRDEGHVPDNESSGIMIMRVMEAWLNDIRYSMPSYY